MAPKNGRIEARVSPDERQQIDCAAKLAGESVSSFVVSAAMQRAEHVIAESAVTLVPADYFDRLLASIDEAEHLPRLALAAKRASQSHRIR